MWLFALLVVGALVQWKTSRVCARYAQSGASPIVGKTFVELADRPDEVDEEWLEMIKASPWDATGELPVVRPGDGAIDTQPRLGET